MHKLHILSITILCTQIGISAAASSSSSSAAAPQAPHKKDNFTVVAFLKKSGVDPRKIEHDDSIYYDKSAYNEHVEQVRHLHRYSAVRTCAIFTHLPSEDIPFDELFRQFAINRMAILLVAQKPIQSELYGCLTGTKKLEPLTYAQALKKINNKMIFEWLGSPECRRLKRWFKTFKKKQAKEEAPFEESSFGPVHEKTFEDCLTHLREKREDARTKIEPYLNTLSSFPESGYW